MTISKYLFGSMILIGAGTQAFALPHHISVETGRAKAGSPCVYPDGTSPKGAPIHCYTPQQFMAAYGIDKLHAMGLTGKGQTIILADSFGTPTAQADLDHFSDVFGLPRTTIEFIYPNGPYTNTMTDNLPGEQPGDHAGWAGETTLDLQWAHAIAPDAKIVNIVTNSSETTGMAGLADLFAGIEMAAQKYPGAIISMSFGTGESTFSSGEMQSQLQGALHKILADATAAGITLLASAGDNGTANETLDQKSMYPFADASYPATDPLITSVGGTALEFGWLWTPEGTADDYWNCQIAMSQKGSTLKSCPKNFFASANSSSAPVESVWKEDWAIAAGGGGVSKVFAAPAFQAGLSADVQKVMGGFRSIPDVSLNAAINGGVDVYMTAVDPTATAPSPKWQSFGGTSCASPETAGLIALAGQQASDQLGKTVGIGALNPILYSLSSQDFNDILPQSFGASSQVVIDNNSIYFNAAALPLAGPTKMTPVAVSGFAVTPGYDIATGLGSPNAPNFVLDLARARVAQEAAISQAILSER